MDEGLERLKGAARAAYARGVRKGRGMFERDGGRMCPVRASVPVIPEGSNVILEAARLYGLSESQVWAFAFGVDGSWKAEEAREHPAFFEAGVAFREEMGIP